MKQALVHSLLFLFQTNGSPCQCEQELLKFWFHINIIIMKKEECPFPYVFEAKSVIQRMSKLGAKTGGLGASLLDINWDNIEL